MNKLVKFKGTVTLHGVTIAWSTSKRMTQDESGDWDQQGEDTITVSTNGAVSYGAMQQAMSRVEVLEKARAVEPRLSCPYTDARISVTGLDDIGHLLVQIIRDGVPRGHGPAWHFANLEPENYSDSGATAVQSISFIRDACRIVSRSEGISLREIEERLFALRPNAGSDPNRVTSMSRTSEPVGAIHAHNTKGPP